jgi:hypothetical protein
MFQLSRIINLIWIFLFRNFQGPKITKLFIELFKIFADFFNNFFMRIFIWIFFLFLFSLNFKNSLIFRHFDFRHLTEPRSEVGLNDFEIFFHLEIFSVFPTVFFVRFFSWEFSDVEMKRNESEIGRENLFLVFGAFNFFENKLIHF